MFQLLSKLFSKPAECAQVGQTARLQKMRRSDVDAQKGETEDGNQKSCLSATIQPPKLETTGTAWKQRQEPVSEQKRTEAIAKMAGLKVKKQYLNSGAELETANNFSYWLHGSGESEQK